MGIRDASGSQKIVIFANALIRLAQFVVAAAALGVYNPQRGYWIDHDIPNRTSYILAIASLTIITATAFAVIPFILSYRPVAFGAAWDLVLAILWGAAFGLMKAIFLKSYEGNDTGFYHHGKDDRSDFLHHWNTMMSAAYINLAGCILFLISAVMGVVLLVVGRRSAKGAMV